MGGVVYIATVLIVDDDRALTRLLRLVLRDEGFEVLIGHDGGEGLTHVAQSDPNIVVLDLHMPVMDGREFYRELRSQGHNVPVLLLSGSDNVAAAHRSLGTEGYLAKPCLPEDVLAAIRGLI